MPGFFFEKNDPDIVAVVITVLFMLLLVFPMKFFKKKIPQGFDKVKDLVRGTITTDLSDLARAYNDFVKIPGVKVVAIKEKLEKLQNITINFVFRESFVGEMQFRFSDFPPNYHANHLIYEIERSRQKIEILESLNKEAVNLCKKGMLRTMDDSEASSKSDDELISRNQVDVEPLNKSNKSGN